MKKLFFASIFILTLGAGLFAQDCATGYCPATITVHHKAGAVSPVTGDIAYGVVTTTLFTGTNQCAITRNLGATTVATSATDNSATSSGWYWQFNTKQGYSYVATRTPNTTWITSIPDANDWLAPNDPCTLLLGTTWRLPTATEWTTADAANNWTSYTGTYNSPLAIHAAGILSSGTGNVTSRGSMGTYWSSTRTDSSLAQALGINATTALIGGTGVATGATVRCLRDY